MSVFIRSATTLRAVGKKLTFVISSKACPTFRHEELRCFERQQRTRKAVSQIDYLIDAPPPYVGNYSFKSGEVSVYVRDDGQAHDLK